MGEEKKNNDMLMKISISAIILVIVERFLVGVGIISSESEVDFLRNYGLTAITTVVMLGYFMFYKGGLSEFKAKIKVDPFDEYEQPNFATGLGIFGTFVGITYGLMFFDTDNISGSVPVLLAGMKTAFITSLVGMVLSFYMKHIQRKAQQNYYAKHPQVGPAAISDLIKYLKKKEEKEDLRSANLMNYLRESQESLKESRNSLGHDLSLSIKQMTDSIVGSGEYTLNSEIRDLKTTLHTALVDMNNSLMESQQNHVTQFMNKFHQVIREHDENMRNSILEANNRTVAMIQMLISNINEANKAQTDSIKSLEESNQQLIRALDNFTDKVSNSQRKQLEQLLRNIVGSFNENLTEQFGDNFRKFGESVEQLQAWQENYKEIIEQHRYREEELLNKIKDAQEAMLAIGVAGDRFIAISKQIDKISAKLTQQTEYTATALAKTDGITDVRSQLQSINKEISSAMQKMVEFSKAQEAAASKMVVEQLQALGKDVIKQNKLISDDLSKALESSLKNNSRNFKKELENKVLKILETLTDSASKMARKVENENRQTTLPLETSGNKHATVITSSITTSPISSNSPMETQTTPYYFQLGSTLTCPRCQKVNNIGRTEYLEISNGIKEIHRCDYCQTDIDVSKFSKYRRA